jgi:imidazolonepropionase-like amidohydrolase
MVLVDGADSWKVTDLLKENNVAVIIKRTQALPMRDDDDIDLPYKLPALLKAKGVDFAITDEGFWKVRNLPFEAGTAVGYGLSKEDALTSITLAPAKILGIDATTGSLEDGKDATLFVSTGDALDMTTNNVEMAFIQGRQIEVFNFQQELYERYMRKYKLPLPNDN